MKTPTLDKASPPASQKPGFTLIEIVIVLAIAAVLMVLVFVAVSGRPAGSAKRSAAV